MKKNISKTISDKKTPEFKDLVNNSSDIFQRYINKNEGKNYLIQILAGELKNIRTSLDAQISNKFSISIAQYFETNKDLLLKEFNQESVISEALTYSFDKVMTSSSSRKFLRHSSCSLENQPATFSSQNGQIFFCINDLPVRNL